MAALGIGLTALIGASSFYFEYSTLQERAKLRNQLTLQRAGNRFQQLVWDVELASDYLGRIGSSWSSADLDTFLDRLEPNIPNQSGWLVSELSPSPKSGSSNDRVKLTEQSAKVEPNAANSAQKVFAPVIFASSTMKNDLAGFDLLTLSALSDLTTLVPSADTPIQFDYAEATPSLMRWPSGSIFLSKAVVNTNPQGGTYVISRVVPANEVESLLEIQDGRSFAALDPDGKSQIVGNKSVLQNKSNLLVDLAVKPQRLRIAVEPLLPPNPSVWLPLSIMGLLVTGLVSLFLVSMHLGRRSQQDRAQLFGTQFTLHQIRNSEEALFENAGTANCVVDRSTGKFLRVNSRMQALLGYSKEELLDLGFADVTHPDDKGVSQIAVDAIASQQQQYIQFEKRYIHKSGHVVHCLVNSRAIQSPSGVPEAFATAIVDISEAKAQERLRDSLVRELAHRVRNTVQLTAAIARQTAKSARSVSDYDDKFQKRLNALRAAQDVLFDSNWTSAPLNAVVHNSLAPFMETHRGDKRLQIDVPDLQLPAQHAQTLALAVHELAANSSVWGALARGGHASLTGKVENTAKGEILHLNWSETGNFTMKQPRKRGFGMRVLESGLPKQFNGSSRLTWRKDGLDYVAELPLTGLADGHGS